MTFTEYMNKKNTLTAQAAELRAQYEKATSLDDRYNLLLARCDAEQAARRLDDENFEHFMTYTYHKAFNN